MPLISFILPIFNEEGNLPRLWSELQNLEIEISKLNINKISDIGPSDKVTLNQADSPSVKAQSLTNQSGLLLAKNNEELAGDKRSSQNDEKTGQTNKFECQFVFVNDGSSDRSWNLLKEIYYQNPTKVKLINFSRNFGHQIAVSCGQNETVADAVIIMDTDLQDPPLVCLELIKKWQEGYDIVYAQRKKYKTSFIKEVSAFVFYRLMAKIAQVEIPVDTGDFRLLSGRVNEEMKKFPEKNRFLRGISCLVGFKSAAVQFDRSERFAGKPGYSFQKSLKLAIDGLTSFSLFPIRIVSITGLFFAIFGCLFGFLYILWSLLTHKTSDGWASLMFVIIFLGGVQLLMLGILGEYIGRIFTEVLNRPLYTIAEKLEPVKKS